MNRKWKGTTMLALFMAMSMAGNSMVYAGESVPVKTEETAKEDVTKENPENEAEDDIVVCNEGEHELVESEVILPTCTEKGYTLYKCKVDGCTYEEKRDETEALGHDMKEVSIQEATADNPGVITYKCQRQGCDYTELTKIPVKDPNASDETDNDKISDPDTKVNEKPGTDNADSDKSNTDNNADTDKGNHSGDKNDANSGGDEELPDEDIDTEYAAYASSTSTDIVTEYDPETAVRTIRVAKKNADNQEETEEVTGKTVPTETTEIKTDSDGNITDLAVSTAIDEIKNGFSLTSDNKKLHSIAIIDKMEPKKHWITLRAKETASELGIHFHKEGSKVIITLTENEKRLNIINLSDTEKELILTTSTGGTCVINKVVRRVSVDKDGKYSDKKTLGKKNQIIINDADSNKAYLELAYVKDEDETAASGKGEETTGNLESGNSKAETMASGESESKGSDAEKKKDPDEELYWIQPYEDEDQEPIVITIYKK